MRKITSVAAIITACLLTGCCSFGSQISHEGWELEEKSLPGVRQDWQKPGRDITFVIDANGKFYGCSGINRYFGTAKLDTKAKTLKFGNIGTTMMTGPGSKYEQAYLKMLETVDSYKICDDDLFFISKGKVVAEFDHESLRDINDNDYRLGY